jgi:hypothetical protein
VTLALSGCGPDGRGEGDDVSRTPRERPESLAAPLLQPDPALVPAVAPSPPVPQDPVAREPDRAARRDRMRADLLSAYQAHGQRDLRWDIAAARALTAWAHAHARPTVRDGPDEWEGFQTRPEVLADDQARAWTAAREALAAGCDDPLVNYVFARLSYGECAVDLRTLARAYAAAAEGMRRRAYPARLRAEVFARAGDFHARQSNFVTADLGRAERLLAEALDLLPEVAREARGSRVAPYAPYLIGRAIIDAHLRSPDRHPAALEEAYAKVAAVLDGDPAARVNALLLTGETQMRLAWRARGRGPAVEVTADGWDDFDARLKKAGEALGEAWSLDPNCPEVPRLMIRLETYQGQGRERMERWFEKAMRIDNDDYPACQAKLEYLEPRWHGSEADMLAFGRACLQTENWEGRLPFILVEAHRFLTRMAPIPNASVSPEVAYYSRPHVWEDVRAVYEPYLALHPGSRYDKTWYARFAAASGHFDVAHRCFEELGKDWWKTVFRESEYQQVREMARNRAASPARAGTDVRWPGPQRPRTTSGPGS